MVYVARTLFMPSGEELSQKVVYVDGCRVLSVTDFIAEVQSMILVDEMYIAASDSLSTMDDIYKEAHSLNGPLYAYSADSSGNLSLLG